MPDSKHKFWLIIIIAIIILLGVFVFYAEKKSKQAIRELEKSGEQKGIQGKGVLSKEEVLKSLTAPKKPASEGKTKGENKKTEIKNKEEEVLQNLTPPKESNYSKSGLTEEEKQKILESLTPPISQ